MKNVKVIKTLIRKNSYFCFVYIPSILLIFLIFMLLLCYPDIASKGVGEGIEMCTKTLLPSIFPFMFFSSLIMNLKIIDGFFKKMTKISKLFFDLPSVAMPIIIMSLIGGYPIGAFLIKNAFEKGKISALQGKRMMLFCVNPGIGFTYSLIGSSLYNSFEIGIILFVISVLSALIIGFFTRFYEDGEDYTKVESFINSKMSASEALLDSINVSTHNIANVCVWVIIFSCISALADILLLNKPVLDFLKMVSEVTNGVMISKKDYSIYILNSVVGFCGFCIHMQIMPTLTCLKMKYSHFLCSRILSSSLYCILTSVALDLFKINVDTIYVGAVPQNTEIRSSVTLCVFLMIMCGLFVLGDNFTAYIKEKNKSVNKGNKAELY